MGAAGAPIRLSLLAGALSLGCGRAVHVDMLRSTETIVGRAARDGQIVLLTDAPALIVIDPAAARLTRQPVRSSDGASLQPWGLAEDRGSLFTVSRFVDLMKIDIGGSATRAARLDRPVANLLDLESGMAGQYAGEREGAPLAVSVDADGAFAPLRSPARRSFGLSTVEEGILHLLSCSAPPRVVCWLPDHAAIFEAGDAALRLRASLEGVPSVNASEVVSGSARRPIDDVLPAEDGKFLVLHRADDASGRHAVTMFDGLGRREGTLRLEEPVRVLLATDADSVLALTKAGALRKWTLPW